MTIEQLEAFSETKPELRYLTEEIIKYMQANPGGSPGGGALLSATVELTDDQIKALPTTRVQLVAAPGASKMLLPIAAYAYFNNIVAAYTNVTNASWVITPDTNVYLSSPASSALPLAASSGTPFLRFNFPNLVVGGSSETLSQWDVNQSALVNKGLYIKDDFYGVSNYTGGDAANTLKVTVYYVVVDL